MSRAIQQANSGVTLRQPELVSDSAVRYIVSVGQPLQTGGRRPALSVGYEDIPIRVLAPFNDLPVMGEQDDADRIDRNSQHPDHLSKVIIRTARQCANDVMRDFEGNGAVILESLTGESNADLVWEAIYPVQVAAEIESLEAGRLVAFQRYLTTESIKNIAALPEGLRGKASLAITALLKGCALAITHQHGILDLNEAGMKSRAGGGVGPIGPDARDILFYRETGRVPLDMQAAHATTAHGDALGEKLAQVIASLVKPEDPKVAALEKELADIRAMLTAKSEPEAVVVKPRKTKE